METPNTEKVIQGLETCISACHGNTVCLDCRYSHDYDGGCEIQLLEDCLALVKAKETSLEKVAADYGLTADGVSFALSQYQTVISEITRGRMSKLSYYARDILSVANDVQCDECELKETHEPIEPLRINHDTKWQQDTECLCGKCGGSFYRLKVNFCPWCGKEVKWK